MALLSEHTWAPNMSICISTICYSLVLVDRLSCLPEGHCLDLKLGGLSVIICTDEREVQL